MSAVAPARPRAFVVWFRDTLRWDVAFFQQLKWEWPDDIIRPVGDAIIRRREEVDPNAERVSLPIIGKISFGGTISVTAPDDRIGYKGRLFWANAGNLIYSKIRAKQGSLAIVPKEVGRLAVSPEYPVYEINDKVADPAYLALVFRSSPFMQLLEGLSHGGSTKTRIPPEEFERQRIPIPPLPVQRKIVAAWEAARKYAADAAAKIQRLEHDIEARFLADLGLKAPKQVTLPKAFAVPWKDLERWGVRPNQLATTGIDISRAKYGVVKGRNCLAEVKHGCSASPSAKPTGLEVLKISAATSGYFKPDERKYAFDRARYRSDFDLRAGDVLMCRTNGTLALVGMSALVEADMPDLIFPDKLIRVRCKATILPGFFWKLAQMPFVRSQIEAAARTAVGNYAIGSDDIWELRFPLPPLPIQQAIMKRVEAGRARIAKLKADAKARADAAKADIEAMILGTKPVA